MLCDGSVVIVDTNHPVIVIFGHQPIQLLTAIMNRSLIENEITQLDMGAFSDLTALQHLFELSLLCTRSRWMSN